MKLLVCLLLTLNAQLTAAAIKQIETKKSGIEFSAKGRPALISITGEAPFNQSSLSIEDGKISGTLTVALQMITTGIELRDEHLKEKYLEVAKFPEATLVIEGVSIQGDRFEGRLILHGVEQKISGTKEVKSDLSSVKAAFDIKLTDFKITIPSFQGITVADVVTVTAKLNLKETK